MNRQPTGKAASFLGLAVFIMVMSLIVVTILSVAMDRGRAEGAMIERLPTRPELCAPFYRQGDDQWIECMGVGK